MNRVRIRLLGICLCLFLFGCGVTAPIVEHNVGGETMYSGTKNSQVDVVMTETKALMPLDDITLNIAFSNSARKLLDEGMNLIIDVRSSIDITPKEAEKVGIIDHDRFNKANHLFNLLNKKVVYTAQDPKILTINELHIDPTILITTQKSYFICIDMYSEIGESSVKNKFVVDDICFNEYDQEGVYDVFVDTLGKKDEGKDNKGFDSVENYKKLSNIRNKLEKKPVDLFHGVSTEGGELSELVGEGKTQIIEEVIYGEMGKKETSFYYSDTGEVYAIVIKVFNYNSPIYYDQSMAEEMGGEAFDQAKSTVVEEAIFIENNSISAWHQNGIQTDKHNDVSQQKKINELIEVANTLWTDVVSK